MLLLLGLVAALLTPAQAFRKLGDGASTSSGTHAFTGLQDEASLSDVAQWMLHQRQESQVLMSPQEMSMIESYLQPHMNFLEWGSGRSTLWYSRFVKMYYSIEHYAPWFEQIQPHIDALGNVQYLMAHVPDGHKGWGGGIEEGTYDQFEEYVKKVDEFQVQKFDRVLIDGRARAPCAEYVLKYLRPDSIVFIHDFHVRPYYHEVVDRYYTKVGELFEGQTLVVLRPRDDAIKRAESGALYSSE